MRNFNEGSRKGVTYDNIKSHKKAGFSRSLEDAIFQRTTMLQCLLLNILWCEKEFVF